MRPIVIGLCLLLGLAAGPARADDASDRKSIVRTWKLTKVEVAWNEAWVGGEQTRFIRFAGDHDDLLHIEGPPMPHPNLAGQVVRVIVSWQRDQ
jgi:hypothetical protein